MLGVLPSEDYDEETYTASSLVMLVRCDNIDAFEAFCVLCLKHSIGSAAWRKSYRKDKISSVYTISDEAFSFLVLDNNRSYWKAYYNTDNIENDKPATETRYMVRGSMGGVKGWHVDGIKVYNSLLAAVMDKRKLNDSKVAEEILQNKWNADKRNDLRGSGKIIEVADDESEEEVQPLIVDF